VQLDILQLMENAQLNQTVQLFNSVIMEHVLHHAQAEHSQITEYALEVAHQEHITLEMFAITPVQIRQHI